MHPHFNLAAGTVLTPPLPSRPRSWHGLLPARRRLLQAGCQGGWLLVLLAASRAEEGVTAERPPDQWAVKGWSTLQGLPSNQVTALAQTREGFLWVGTSAGLVRFDGARFTPAGEDPGWKDGPVAELVALPGGGLWMKDRKADRYWLRQGRLERDPGPWQHLIAGGDGKTYAYHQSAVVTLDEAGVPTGEPIPFPRSRAPGQGRLQVVKDGRMWLLQGKDEDEDESEDEVWTRRDGPWTVVRDFGRMMRPTRFLGAETDGALWLWPHGPTRRETVRATGLGVEAFPLPPVFQHGIHKMAEDGRGTMWAGVWAGGIFRWRGGDPVPQLLGQDQPQPAVTALLKGAGGEMWVGTEDQGLFRLTHAAAHFYPVTTTGSGKVTALLVEPDGAVLAGTQGSGLFRWRPEGVTRLAEDADFNRTYIYGNDFLTLPQGQLWVAMGGALHEIRGGEVKSDKAFVSRFSSNNDSMFSLCPDGAGGFWTTSHLGRLFHVRDRTVEEIALPPPQRRALVSVNRDAGGNLWIVSRSGGVLKMTPERQFTVYGEAEGLPDAPLAMGFMDSKDRFWLGSDGAGLFRFESGKFHPVAVSGPKRLTSVLQLQEDADGWLWLGTLGGLCGVDPSSLAADPAQPPAARWLGAADGMESEQCTRMRAVRDAAGRLYFGTSRGFVRFDPREVKTPLRLPTPLIEQVRVEDRTLPVRSAADPLPPGSRLEVSFTGLDPGLSDDLKFRYRLAGLQETWMETGSARSVEFAQLPPGTYRFEVQAGRQGQWHPQPAVLALEVERFFWQTWWFRALAASGLILGIAAVLKLLERQRLRRVMAELERSRAVDAERTRIARDLHDSLGAGLTQVNVLAQLWVNTASLPTPALKLKDRLRDLATELDNAVWITNPAFDHLPALCDYLVSHVTGFLEDAGISCVLDLPVSIPSVPVSAGKRQHLFQSVKEALTNVVKHSGASQARFTLRMENHGLLITLRDNGKGFDPEEAARKGRNGLKNIPDRLHLIGGQAVISASPSGTHVELLLPVPS